MSQLDDVRTYQRVQTFCLLTLTLMALGMGSYLLRPVLVPFVLAVFLTYCLTPLIDAQRRYLRMPRGLAIVSAVILAVVVLALCGSVVATSISSASQRWPDYEKQFQDLTERFASYLPLERLGIKTDTKQIRAFLVAQEGAGWQFASAVLSEATNVLSNGTLVMIFMLFLLLGRRSDARPSGNVLVEIETSVKSYIVRTIFLSAVTGLLLGLTLALLGVEFAWVFGLIAFMLNFVPTIGAIVASLLPLPVILLSPDMSLTAKVLAITIPAAVQFVIGSFVQPRVQGHALDLHPVVIVLALIFFGMIWGLMGAFLATPITAVVRIIFARIPITRPLAGILAGNLDVLSAEGDGIDRKKATRPPHPLA
jgi:AI-2 transport protein TqsA